MHPMMFWAFTLMVMAMTLGSSDPWEGGGGGGGRYSIPRVDRAEVKGHIQ